MANTYRSMKKEAFWRRLLTEHQRSGLSIRAFCREQRISEPSFYAWRREINKRDAELVRAEGKSRKRVDHAGQVAQRLIPVDIVEFKQEVSPSHDKTSPPWLEIVTPSGFTLRFDPHVEPHRVNVLLDLIVKCPSGADSC